MEVERIYCLLGLFFAYSFAGWVFEVMAAAVRRKQFVNRGVLGGPLCCIYGFAALAVPIGLQELRDRWIFLFLGAAIVCSFVEWVAGHLLERLYHRRWWDYSGRKGCIDHYICLGAAATWGIAGLIGLKFVNPLLLTLLHWVPPVVLRVLIWVALGLLAVDAVGAYMTILKVPERWRQVEEIQSRLLAGTVKVSSWITARVQRRMEKAYPSIRTAETVRAKPLVFAEGCGFYKLMLLFFIGAFLGDLAETIFCRLTAGVWMSRSSVVWGPFSIVWGLAIMIATKMLYNYRERSDGFLFVLGTVLGGAYEYLCSVFTELAFGVVFWDYSEIPFNLGGRINLLYCFFWGIAAVVWLKKLYPLLSGLIEKLPMRRGKILTWCLVVFMVCNIAVSVLALARQSERAAGQPASNGVELWLDDHYGDAVMGRIYPNSIQAEQK